MVEGRVDPDELSIVARDVIDLERRLGIDELLENALPLVPKFSFNDIGKKMIDGGRFYLEGSKLLGTDIQYALKLVTKAAFGVTLQPREVRTLRRTVKDVVTFIPFAIILIIPLSPVGHVIVFSFIQRFFPDFFPSPYTDRRQNLVRIYQSVEISLNQNARTTTQALRNIVAPHERSSAGKRPRHEHGGEGGGAGDGITAAAAAAAAAGMGERLQRQTRA
eukprot:CAMPEP_0181306764 /NCGR_PEP_ID=MMETSP1101-20121128/10490_1 /TAXON_ID=46948 /ORGANISM="Rhodomonas abbreviata, Strain Caron Lab Isolate" /LENGTH=219 /DNA_ID=CAMNT_0023412875 /DNA_START=12 /DNA_END=668 /DNA_ORIENTATION=-